MGRLYGFYYGRQYCTELRRTAQLTRGIGVCHTQVDYILKDGLLTPDKCGRMHFQTTIRNLVVKTILKTLGTDETLGTIRTLG